MNSPSTESRRPLRRTPMTVAATILLAASVAGTGAVHAEDAPAPSAVGTLVVTPQDVTVTYGDAEPGYLADVSGFVGEDGASSAGYTAPTCDSDYDAGDPVGDYTITCQAGSLEGYDVDVSAVATLTVEPATLTVSPQDVTVTYGDAEPGYLADVSGFVGEDGASSAGYTAPTCDSDYDAGDPVGDYTVTCQAGSLEGYDVDVSAVATLTVEPATLTVTPQQPAAITYGDPAPSGYPFDVSGFVLGEDASTATAYEAPSCASQYEQGDPAGTYPVTCTGGAATDYSFDLGSADLVVGAIALDAADIGYSGQELVYTSGSSDTSARVTLSASITADMLDCESGTSVIDAVVTFRDDASGAVLARNVPIAEVAGDCTEGIATTFATLGTGQSGITTYVVRVEVSGSLTGSAQDGMPVTVAQPDAPGTIQGAGTLAYIPNGGPGDPVVGDLGTEGSLTTGMGSSDEVFVSFRFVPGTKKVIPKGAATLLIPAADGAFYLVKSNSITSVGAGTGTAAVFTKANITYFESEGALGVAVDGNVSLRLDVTDSGDLVGLTIQSTKTSELYYSNHWVKQGKTWKTVSDELVSTLMVDNVTV